ncbi:MAG: bifunctional GNAT family N-acetyltransferase/carbon-nitrogen hydrolase family protein [Sandaracinaceae bacterium]|nr:bifunctional GNAT family N-acetyltransferase/carbon-nitrogen hydrolase family protein [Sandaracinaceae bacterium]
MSIDVSDFETRIRVRPLTLEDYSAYRALLLACFPKLPPWNEDQFASMLRHFPEGQVAIEIDAELVASSCALIVRYDDYTDWHDYLEISDRGYITNHDPEGDTLYGIELMVHPGHRGRKLARRLYDHRKQLCRDHNLARMIIGGRIPGYAAHRGELSAHQYVERVIGKSLYDPVLTTQLSNGFQLRQLIEDYLPSDEDSGGWATCLEWPNLDYVPHTRFKKGRRLVHSVRLALVQYQMRQITSWEQFEAQCEFFVDTASDYKADFLCFPELFTVQLLSLVEPGRPERGARDLARFTPEYLELFGRLATHYAINIVGGTSLAVEDDGRLYNVAYFFHRDGRIEQQRKIHPTPNETRWWGVRGGDELNVFETDFGKVAILVCYDAEFPELARVAVDRGAQILFVPSNTNDRRGHLRVRICCQARAIENQVYVVNAGCVGNLPFVENADTHYAQSGIFTPSDIMFARDGVAAEAEPNVETVLFQDVDLELLRHARRTGTTQNWLDRRGDLYRVLWRPDDPAAFDLTGGDT